MFSSDPSACYELKLKMAEKYHWIIKSPFIPGEYWYAGLTPLGVTGWNGTPDYEESGKTEMEAVCKCALVAIREEQGIVKI
jgi:hypothetical protein